MTSYKPDFCSRLKVHCENGKSLESFCAAINVSPKVITEWYLEYPEFREAVEMAPCLELLYWEMQIIGALAKGDKESIAVAKNRLDHLAKYVVSPLKKNTYSDLKELNPNKQHIASGDLVKDLNLLMNKKSRNNDNTEL